MGILHIYNLIRIGSFSNAISRTAAVSILFIIMTSTLHAENGNWLHVALSGEPLRPTDYAQSHPVVHNNVFECLVRYGEKSHIIEPCLAASWKVEEAGRVWIFNLRDNVLFHDGSMLAADDVVSSFKKQSLLEGKIEKIDRLSIRFVLDNKNVSFIKRVSMVEFSIKKSVPGRCDIGTGPFVIMKWEPSNEIVLRAFQDYWGKRPSIDGVIYQCSLEAEKALNLMREGVIDVIHTVPPRLADEIGSDNGLVLSKLEGVNISYIRININHPPLDEIEFRRALNILINREYIINNVYSSQAVMCGGLLPPMLGGKNENLSRVAYDPKEAKRIINKYLTNKDRVFKLIGLPIPRPYCPEPNSLARLIAGYFKGAGMKIEYVRTRSMLEYGRRSKEEDCDFIMAGWIIDSLSPDDFFINIFGIGDIKTWLGSYWKNAMFESLILNATTTVSVRKRWELYQQATDIFFEEYPWIILVHTNMLGAYRKEITGLKFGPTGEIRLGEVFKKR